MNKVTLFKSNYLQMHLELQQNEGLEAHLVAFVETRSIILFQVPLTSLRSNPWECLFVPKPEHGLCPLLEIWVLCIHLFFTNQIHVKLVIYFFIFSIFFMHFTTIERLCLHTILYACFPLESNQVAEV